MAGTFLCPNSCGFAKVCVVEISRQTDKGFKNTEGKKTLDFRNDLNREKYLQYKNAFEDVWHAFEIDYSKFVKKLPSLKATINKWNFRLSDQKKKFMDTFSLKNWINLPTTRKREHSLNNCKSCAVRFTEVQSYFPVKSRGLKGKAMNNPVFAASQVAQSLRGTVRKTVPSKQDAKSTAEAWFNTLAPSFQDKYNIPLAEALSKVPGLNLQNKTQNQIRENRRQHYRKTKESIEKQMEETAFIRY